jgi:undecaprenyl-diphosphatase
MGYESRMALVEVTLLAALQGLSEALPVSRSGHEVVARLWERGSADAIALEGLLHLGTAAAFATVTRRTLVAAIAEGARALVRPTLFVTSPAAREAAVVVLAAVASGVTSALVVPYVETWNESPAATGIGLCLSGAALASLSQIPRDLRGLARGPTLPAAVLVGIAHGLAAFPGASRVGAALTMLLWLGVRAGRAIDLALLITIPSLVVAFARAALAHPSVPGGAVALGLAIAFFAAVFGCEALRWLAERRRIPALALWTIPLGLAMLAYAHALAAPS